MDNIFVCVCVTILLHRHLALRAGPGGLINGVLGGLLPASTKSCLIVYHVTLGRGRRGGGGRIREEEEEERVEVEEEG